MSSFGYIYILNKNGVPISPDSNVVITSYSIHYTKLYDVKSNGLFHSYNPDPEVNGMVHEFYVTPEKTEQAEPKASVSIDISSTEGYKITGVV